MSIPPLQSAPGYRSAVAEEARSHDDTASHGSLASAYRDLVRDCAHMAPDFREYESGDLPELTPADLALIQRAKGLTEVNTLKDAQQALLEDVIAECEARNERKAQARDEDYYGSSSPQTERERLESQYGLGRTFK